MKKIFNTLLSLLLIFSMLPVNSFADDENIPPLINEHLLKEEVYSKDSFDFDKANQTITKYKGNDKNVVIPEKIEGLAVKKIGKKAFAKSKIDSVTFNSNMKIIDDGAFIGSSIKTVTLNEGLEKIGELSFAACKRLENINFPNSLISIGSNAFKDSSNLSGNLHLGENFENLFTNSFYNCKNIKITISDRGTPIRIYENNLYDASLPISVPNTRKVFIAARAFKGDSIENYTIDLGTINVKENISKEELKTELEKIPFNIGKTNADFSVVPYELVWDLNELDFSKPNIISAHLEGCPDCELDKIKIKINLNPISNNTDLDNSNFTFDKNTKTIKKYIGSDKDVVIPEKIDNVIVEKLASGSFAKSKIDSITFNKNLQEIDKMAFAASTVKKVVANEGLEKIGFNAFSNCKNLTEFNFPSTLISVDRYAFKNCPNLEGTLNIGENFELLHSSALASSPKVKLNISKKGVAVKILENNISEINSNLHLPNNREIFLAKTAFLAKGGSIDFGVLKVDEHISKKDLEEKLNKIPFYYGTTDYKNGKTIISSKEKISWNLDNFDIRKSNEIKTKINIDNSNVITVKIKILPEYDSKSSTWTSEDFTYGDIPSTMLKTPTFFGITGLSKKGYEKIKTQKHLTIPFELEVKEGDKTINKKVRGIGREAFNKLEIEKLTLPEMKDGYNQFIIESSAFADNKLSELNIPEGVFAFDTFAFANNDIKSLYIPSSVLKIGSEAFKNNKISKLEISDDVYKIQIDNYSFMNNRLEEVHLPYSVFKIKHYVFQNNTGKDKNGQVYLYTRNPKHLTSDTYIYHSDYQKLILVSEGIDREDLFSTIKSADSLNPEEFEEKSWNKMNQILKDAKKVFRNEKSSQNDIDNENEKLNTAINTLSPASVIKTSLKSEIKTASSYDKKLYTTESWNIFISALDKAKKVFENRDAKQIDVDTALYELRSSMKSLKIKSDMDWTKEDFTYEGSKITGYSKSGIEKFKVNKNLIIPDTSPDGKTITSIGKEAFLTKDGVVYRTDDVYSPLGLKSVKIPDTVEIIEDSAFRQNNLSHVNLPKSLKYIGNTAFNANQLKEIEIPDSVTKMGSGSFSLNLIEKVKFSKGMKEIPNGILSRNIHLKSIDIPEGVRRIGESAFVGAPISKIDIPSSVEVIDYKAFSGQRCDEITIPGNVKYIGKLAFEENVKFRHTKKLILKEGIKEISSGAFKSCLLSEVKLPNSIVKLDEDVFKDNLDIRKNPVTVKLISSNPKHAGLFKNNNMQKIIIKTEKIPHNSSSNKRKNNIEVKNNSACPNRIEGRNRIETAIEVSKKYFNKSSHVILVSSTNLTDSLISPLQAKKLNSPILLSERNKISDSTLAEIKRLGASEIDIIGGNNSIDDTIVKKLKNTGLKVNRIHGSDRYETAIKLTDSMYKNIPCNEVYIVNATNLADGLSVANLSTKLDIPILLTNPDKIDNSIIKYLKKKNVKKIHIIGGENSVSPKVEKALADFKIARIAGKNRYETSRIIVKIAYPSAKSVHIANGNTGIDALVCGAIIPKTNTPMLLVDENDLYSSTWFKNFGIKHINIIGGKSSISEAFANSILN